MPAAQRRSGRLATTDAKSLKEPEHSDDESRSGSEDDEGDKDAAGVLRERNRQQKGSGKGKGGGKGAAATALAPHPPGKQPKPATEAETASPKPAPKRAKKRKDGTAASPAPKPAAKRSRKAPEAPESLHDLTLWDVLTKHPKSAERAAKEWVERYQADKVAATAELMSMIARAGGCESGVSEDDVEAGEMDDVVRRLVDTIVKDGGSEPFRDRKLRQLRGAYESFWTALSTELHAVGRLLDDHVCDRLSNLLVGLSVTKVRGYRHVGTLTAGLLVSGWVRVAQQKTEEMAQLRHQLDAATKAKKPKVAEALKRQLDKAQSQSGQLRSLIASVFSSVFAVRFRDVGPEIRCVVIDLIGRWIEQLPDTFLDPAELPYDLSEEVSVLGVRLLTRLVAVYAEKAQAATAAAAAAAAAASAKPAVVVEDIVDALYERLGVLRAWKLMTDCLSDELTAQVLLAALPGLLRRHQTDPHVTAALVALIRDLQLEQFGLRGDQAGWAGLLRLVGEQLAARAASPDLLVQAAETLTFAATQGPPALQPAASVVLREVSDQLAGGLAAAAAAEAGGITVDRIAQDGGTLELDPAATAGPGTATATATAAAVVQDAAFRVLSDVAVVFGTQAWAFAAHGPEVADLGWARVVEGSERAGAEGDEDAAAAAEDAGLERYGQLAQHIASLYAGANTSREALTDIVRALTADALLAAPNQLAILAWGAAAFVPKLAAEDARALCGELEERLEAGQEAAGSLDPSQGGGLAHDPADPDWAPLHHYLAQLKDKASKGKAAPRVLKGASASSGRGAGTAAAESEEFADAHAAAGSSAAVSGGSSGLAASERPPGYSAGGGAAEGQGMQLSGFRKLSAFNPTTGACAYGDWRTWADKGMPRGQQHPAQGLNAGASVAPFGIITKAAVQLAGFPAAHAAAASDVSELTTADLRELTDFFEYIQSKMQFASALCASGILDHGVQSQALLNLLLGAPVPACFGGGRRHEDDMWACSPAAAALQPPPHDGGRSYYSREVLIGMFMSQPRGALALLELLMFSPPRQAAAVVVTAAAVWLPALSRALQQQLLVLMTTARVTYVGSIAGVIAGMLEDGVLPFVWLLARHALRLATDARKGAAPELRRQHFGRDWLGPATDRGGGVGGDAEAAAGPQPWAAGGGGGIRRRCVQLLTGACAWVPVAPGLERAAHLLFDQVVDWATPLGASRMVELLGQFPEVDDDRLCSLAEARALLPASAACDNAACVNLAGDTAKLYAEQRTYARA
eukprot:XP_001699607.1 cohesin complex subunit [Chlamydomonas reinhardtii]